jgi:hypothetical protein
MARNHEPKASGMQLTPSAPGQHGGLLEIGGGLCELSAGLPGDVPDPAGRDARIATARTLGVMELYTLASSREMRS